MARPSVPGAGVHPDAPAGDTVLAVHDDGAGHYDSLDSAAPPPAAPRDAAGREVRFFSILNTTFWRGSNAESKEKRHCSIAEPG
ncbi:hypothetical protein C2845_PM04G04870 [Panicum miliaceum]|uniref:Uncharacterized protein n=1 Tax=Panicum miliaceum TaxID=4540 RepID=A0A3L6QKQ2_PANMI|nr:hypothetical protein C2845_PM04G04870 [Panicum miliaceum]